MGCAFPASFEVVEVDEIPMAEFAVGGEMCPSV